MINSTSFSSTLGILSFLLRLTFELGVEELAAAVALEFRLPTADGFLTLFIFRFIIFVWLWWWLLAELAELGLEVAAGCWLPPRNVNEDNLLSRSLVVFLAAVVPLLRWLLWLWLEKPDAPAVDLSKRDFSSRCLAAVVRPPVCVSEIWIKENLSFNLKHLQSKDSGKKLTV